VFFILFYFHSLASVSLFCDWILKGIPKLGFRFTHDPKRMNNIIITCGFTRRRVRFKPFGWPTSPSSSYGGKFKNSKTKFFPRFTIHYYGTWRKFMEPPKGLVNIRRQLAPLSWMISSKSLTIGVICSKCVIPNYSHPSWHVRVCFNIWRCRLWMIIMSLNVPMIFKLKCGDYISLPIMFLSLRDFVPPSVATTTTNINSASGSGNTNVSGATKSGGTTEGGGAMASIICGVHCLHLTQLWNFFVSCGKITKRLKLKNYEVCRISSISPMRACEKHMHECMG